jgi:hypothetical protein
MLFICNRGTFFKAIIAIIHPKNETTSSIPSGEIKKFADLPER